MTYLTNCAECNKQTSKRTNICFHCGKYPHFITCELCKGDLKKSEAVYFKFGTLRGHGHGAAHSQCLENRKSVKEQKSVASCPECGKEKYYYYPSGLDRPYDDKEDEFYGLKIYEKYKSFVCTSCGYTWSVSVGDHEGNPYAKCGICNNLLEKKNAVEIVDTNAHIDYYKRLHKGTRIYCHKECVNEQVRERDYRGRKKENEILKEDESRRDDFYYRKLGDIPKNLYRVSAIVGIIVAISTSSIWLGIASWIMASIISFLITIKMRINIEEDEYRKK